MSADQIKILEAALDLLGVIAIFAFSILIVESLDTNKDLKDDKEISQRLETPEPISKINEKE